MSGRPVTVSVYDAAGNLVRWRGGAVRDNVRRLRFSSGLPGGFLACEFEMATPTARHWPVQAGFRCVVSLGQDVVWWGWVEDITTRQRGGQRWLAVQALGPWQQVNQRLITLDYVDINSTYVLRDMLATYCPDLSTDYSQLENSGVPLTIDWQYKRLAELVKTGRIELAERADYEDLTLPALQAAKARLTPGKHGPKGGADAQGTVQLDGKPPENAATNTPEADALLNQIRIG
jgi:hypothetical protein